MTAHKECLLEAAAMCAKERQRPAARRAEKFLIAAAETAPSVEDEKLECGSGERVVVMAAAEDGIPAPTAELLASYYEDGHRDGAADREQEIVAWLRSADYIGPTKHLANAIERGDARPVDAAKARWRERATQEAAAMERVLPGDEGVPAPRTVAEKEKP